MCRDAAAAAIQAADAAITGKVSSLSCSVARYQHIQPQHFSKGFVFQGRVRLSSLKSQLLSTLAASAHKYH